MAGAEAGTSAGGSTSSLIAPRLSCTAPSPASVPKAACLWSNRDVARTPARGSTSLPSVKAPSAASPSPQPLAPLTAPYRPPRPLTAHSPLAALHSPARRCMHHPCAIYSSGSAHSCACCFGCFGFGCAGQGSHIPWVSNDDRFDDCGRRRQRSTVSKATTNSCSASSLKLLCALRSCPLLSPTCGSRFPSWSIISSAPVSCASAPHA